MRSLFKMWSKRSHFQSVVYGIVLIFINIQDIWTQEDIVPQSPCPEVFNYTYNGTHYSGYGQLNNPPIGQDIVLVAKLVVETDLPSNYSGTLQLVGDLRDIAIQIKLKLPVNFEIIFPTQDPLPLISSITVNNRVFCENSAYTLPNKENVVILQHTFKLSDVQRRPGRKPVHSYFEELNEIKNSFNGKSHRRRSTPDNSLNNGCGKIPPSFTALAFGGTTINKGDWPWLAGIHHYMSSSLSFQCAGTLISSSAIVSAAHCFYSKEMRINAEDIFIFLGHHNLKQLIEDDSIIVNVDSVTIHPDYMTKGKLYSDIAIAKFANTVEFSDFIQPVCLWSESTDINEVVNQVGVVVGWGKDENGNPITEEPKKVQLPIVSEVDCLRSHEAFTKITNDRTYCGGWRNGTEGPCQGDSGTGMMLNKEGIWYIRGVVSASLADQATGSCNLFEYVVFTDVAKFSSWIENNIM